MTAVQQDTGVGYVENAAGTTHNATVPSSIAAGDRLICYINFDAAATASGLTGWTQRANSGVNHACVIFEIISASGSEANFTFSSSASTASQVRIFRVTGSHASSAIEVGTEATGTSTTPDPPSLTPSWGAEANLFVAVAGVNVEATNGYPTSYTLNQYAVKHAAASESQNIAARAIAGSPENPGTFSIANSRGWAAQTVAIRPAAAAAATVKTLAAMGVG